MMMLGITSLMADTWTEDFDDIATGSYLTGDVVISGRTWTAKDAGNFSYANNNMGSYAFTINDDKSGAHITSPGLNTIGTVSFKYAYINGSDTNVFVLQKSYDNTNFVDLDTHTLGAESNLTYVNYSFEVNDSATEVYIRILSDGQNAHLFVEDFSVTDYSGGTEPNPLSVDFSADVTTGEAPLTVNFTPSVTGGTEPYGYAWDFDNDDNVDSTDENPSHTYSTAGTYSVKLTVTDGALASDIEEKINYITVTEETSGSGDELMTNGSLEAWDTATSPTGWDKKESIEQEATIVHSGSYSAKQTAGTKDLGQYVEGIVGGETYTISYWFLDNDPNAKGRIYSYWREGTNTLSDNALELRPSGYSTDSSEWQQISHTLTAPATADNFYFEVRTYNDNSGGGVIYYDDFSVMGAGGTSPELLTVDFSADVLTGQVPLTVNFTNLVTGGTSPYSYSWDFDGDNVEDSDAANPSFTYYAVGTYPVKLYVIDSGTSDGTEYKTAYITVTTSGGDSYYSGITATEGEALKSQLKTLISTNTNTSYDGARAAMYSNIDNINNTVTCVYTGMEVSHNYGDTSAPTDINCEHSYAQSWIEDYDSQNEELRAKADVHHLFPTDSGVNSSRGNLSFDAVNSVEYSYSYATGYVSYRGDNDEFVTVFEPTDQHKGDLARALLYMNVRYDLPLAPPVPNPGPINVNMLATLLEWHGQDPVDAAEITRNDEIHDYQGNRNPFVDYPEWVNAIYGGEPVYTCASPTMNPAGGTFDSVQNVTLETTTADADIYYTTNGDTPTSASSLYSGAIEVATDMTIKAIAVKAGWNDSQMASESYFIDIIPSVSIYDIQYVADPATSDASAYEGQTVNVTGIVTAVNSSSFNISAPAGGAWNGILVYNNTANPTIGDEVTFNGQVVEYNNLTELSNINGFQVLSQGNSVTPTVITTAQASTEAYEGVLVTVENVSVTQAPSNYNEWYVTDGSGDAQIDDEYGYIPEPAPSIGQVYSSITGILDYKYGSFGISPRDANDLQLDSSVNQLPLVSNVSHSPLTVYAADAVTVTADAIDNDGTIATINLKWGTASGLYTTTTAMTPSRATYTADIPAQVEGTSVYYIVEATDDESGLTTSEEGTYTVNAEPSGDAASELFFSEYIEGGSYNKAIEIYNGTGATVDLSNYTIKYGSNGAAYSTTYLLSDSGVANLANNDVLVLAHGSANATILAAADATPSIINHNGDDAYGLFKNDVLIDVIGIAGSGDPGTGWAVAGEANATANKTLVRKPTVSAPTTDWAVSAGSNADDSQWIIYAQDESSYIGSHQFEGGTVTPDVVATPVISPAEGQYNNEVEVTITCATDGATIYYTLDGNDPTTASDVYSAPFTLTADATVKAFATKADMDDSAIAETIYTIVTVVETVETPVITPITGTYYESQEVTITCATDGATIYYTLDGTDPTTGSSEYTLPFTVDATTTVKAMAVKTDWLDSSIAESIITIEEIVVPTGMIISEYIEGSSNNKAIEIYNGTGADVDLTPYTVRLASNGGDWGNTSDMQGMLAADDVFVIANSGSDPAILAVADTTSNITYFNGNDAVGLFYNTILIDVIGLVDGSSESNWDVAGVTGATAEHTLVRKMTVTQGNTDWTVSAGTNTEDSEWIVYPQDTFSYLGSHTEPMEVVASPVISPNGGNFENPIDVTLTCETADASIYYTINGDTPSDASTLYSAPFSLSADATVQAIAVKEGYLNSPVVTADFTFSAVTEVATIAELRAGTLDGPIYRLTGEAILTYQRDSRNQKYIQDATAGILIDDSPGLITTTYNLYDGITNLEGTLNEYNGVLQFVPTVNSNPATSTGNTVIPTLVTIADLNTNFDTYESQLVTIQDVSFVESGTFASGQNYTLTDGTNNLVFRTNFSEADYIGSDISANNLNVTGLAIENQGTSQLASRFASEIEEVTSYEDGINVSRSAMTFETEVGVESASQSYVLYMQGVDLGLVEVTGDFQIQDPDGTWGSDFFFELQEEEVTINVKFNATNLGTVYGEIIHSADGFDDVIIDLTGIANEVLPTPIYDIQYVADPATSDASPYDGQEVIVEGIVTANNYAGSRYFISSPEGGAWNGIYVYDSNNNPELGDMVSFRATVDEYWGWTELKTVTDFQVLSQGNTLPQPTVITTAELASNEAYEGVLVTIENVTVTATVAENIYGEWYVTDGSGYAQIDDNCYALDPAALLGDTFTSITGVVDYSFSNFGLNPRDAADIVAGGGVTELATPVITSITKEVTGIVITWETVDNANSYKVYGSMNPDSGFEIIETVGTNSYTNNGADNMKFFKIEASTDGLPAKK
jgi:predicted extracellular nuclease/endonuclease I